MSDYISREQAVRSARFIYDSDSQLKALTMMRMLRELPSVTPTERTGHWINQDEGAFYPIECSECHKEPLLDSYGDYVFSNYCPVCGARMAEPQESEEV